VTCMVGCGLSMSALAGDVFATGAGQAAFASEAHPAFVFDTGRFAIGVLDRDVDHATRMVGWQLNENLYFGRRRGDIDDFGFVWRTGDTQWSFTEDGIGWKRTVSLRPHRTKGN